MGIPGNVRENLGILGNTKEYPESKYKGISGNT